MNLFVLDQDPVKAAQLQCDKHVVKMVVESAQMLSTVHRMLDGAMHIERGVSKNGRKTSIKRWTLPDQREQVLYKACHTGHPCTVWTMQSTENYNWHYKHFVALCDEYKYRYGKTHMTDTKLRDILKKAPSNMPVFGMTPFALAMGAAPQCMNKNDVVGSYRAFYQTKQARFKMTWTNREIPEWFKVA